ncbi:hypothetical protein PLCT2_03007 [Planctomycetaceae bacterium]|nr:hypothetical protein PLCT2_03007 [Planctomycetaceae bacterium]
MEKRPNWHYALHIKGVTPDTLDMGRIGEYLVEFANLIGHEAAPRFVGMVKGSVMLRSKEQSEHPALVRVRLRDSVADDSTPQHRAFQKINSMMVKDGARGAVVDHAKAVVIQFPGKQTGPEPEEELTVTDTGELDGQVVSIVGTDDTVHVRLQDVDGASHKIVVTVGKLDLARDLAKRFRSGWVRIRVHGTWRRTSEGQWEAATVYADSFEDLDDTPAGEVLRPLQGAPGNGWSELDDPIEEWKRLRGLQ